MTTASRNRLLIQLGLGLVRVSSLNKSPFPWDKDARYRVGPTHSGGTINYFKSLPDVDRHLEQVVEVRAWQA